MNILSFILAIVAICIFAGAYHGLAWGSIGLALALLTASWVLELTWTSATQINF